MLARETDKGSPVYYIILHLPPMENAIISIINPIVWFQSANLKFFGSEFFFQCELYNITVKGPVLKMQLVYPLLIILTSIVGLVHVNDLDLKIQILVSTCHTCLVCAIKKFCFPRKILRHLWIFL